MHAHASKVDCWEKRKLIAEGNKDFSVQELCGIHSDSENTFGILGFIVLLNFGQLLKAKIISSTGLKSFQFCFNALSPHFWLRLTQIRGRTQEKDVIFTM